MSTSPSTWRELYRCDDGMLAQAVAVSIGAMEYPVRLRWATRACGTTMLPGDTCANDRRVCSTLFDADGDSDDDSPIPPQAGPFSVEVDEHDWPLLMDVLDEIVGEQTDFDAYVKDLRARRLRRQRAIAVLLAAVAAAGVFGLVDLRPAVNPLVQPDADDARTPRPAHAVPGVQCAR